MKTKINEILKKAYNRRMYNILVEADIFDKRGNLVIKPGLKVTHKTSGFEYTVNNVVKDGEDIQVSLLKPEEPRFEPPKKLNIKDAPRTMNGFIGNSQTDTSITDTEEIDDMLSPNPDDVFIVDRASFEKEYEVK